MNQTEAKLNELFDDMNDTAAMTQPAPSATPTPTTSTRKTILLGSAGILLLTIIVYTVSRPEEKFGPAEATTGQQHGGMPHDHPAVPSDGQQSEAAKARAQRIELLKAQTDAGGAHEPKLHLELGNLLYDQAQETGDRSLFMESSIAYELYLAENPSDHDARTDYAYTLFQTGRLERSIAELRTVQKENPRHQHSSFNLALMYMEKNIPDSVLHFMRRTAEIDPTTDPGRAATQALQGYDSTHGVKSGSVAD